jgi:hypothetical protein
MRRVFADAVYWIALANRKDQWHPRVVQAMRSLGAVTLVTADEVLDEFLAYYSGHGPVVRSDAVQTVEDALADPSLIVLPQSHHSFLLSDDLGIHAGLTAWALDNHRRHRQLISGRLRNARSRNVSTPCCSKAWTPASRSPSPPSIG